MKKSFALLAAAGVALAACATAPLSPSAPSGPPAIPTSALDLGDYRRANETAVIEAFNGTVTRRYGAGLELTAVVGDLRRNQFTCAAGQAGRGDPPAQICRRTLTESGCTHTWQVHLYDEAGNAELARTRSLYDKRCGGDGLLGGPT